MDKVVLSLYDYSGEMVKPWAKAGYACYCFDIKHERLTREVFESGGRIVKVPADLYNPNKHLDIVSGFMGITKIVFGFPPCTDLAVSGAKHFERKERENPGFQDRAVAHAKDVALLAEQLGVPYMVENPVSVLATKWRKPDLYFHPYQYGGYLTEETKSHPEWPDYFPDWGSYTKKTGIWCGGGFKIPEMEPVALKQQGDSKLFLKLGGKSEKTKTIRSMTPRGFAQAVYEANK